MHVLINVHKYCYNNLFLMEEVEVKKRNSVNSYALSKDGCIFWQKRKTLGKEKKKKLSKIIRKSIFKLYNKMVGSPFSFRVITIAFDSQQYQTYLNYYRSLYPTHEVNKFNALSLIYDMSFNKKHQYLQQSQTRKGL